MLHDGPGSSGRGSTFVTGQPDGTRDGWQVDTECGAASGAVAGCFDAAAVCLDDAVHDREAKAQSWRGAGGAALGLAERVEDKRQEVWRDPATRITDGQFHAIRVGAALTVTVPPPGVNLIALVSRFQITC